MKNENSDILNCVVIVALLALFTTAVALLVEHFNSKDIEADLNGDKQVTLEDFSVALYQLETVTATLREQGVTDMPL